MFPRIDARILLMVCIASMSLPAVGQSPSSFAVPKIEAEHNCSWPDVKPATGPEVRIDNITFSGFLQMPISDQQEIAALVRNDTRGEWNDSTVEEALQRIKAGWQKRGYFNAEVSGEARETASSSNAVHIALFAHVDEHSKYTLKQITFEHRNLSSDFLRSRFLIQDGDAFNREKIEEGLENLRKVYGEMGYINYIGVPKTEFDERNRAISVVVDIDAGKQFYIRSIEVLGLNESAKQALLADFPLRVGAIYNRRLWELGLLRYSSMFQNCECRSNYEIQTDEQTRSVVMTLDFRGCEH